MKRLSSTDVREDLAEAALAQQLSSALNRKKKVRRDCAVTPMFDWWCDFVQTATVTISGQTWTVRFVDHTRPGFGRYYVLSDDRRNVLCCLIAKREWDQKLHVSVHEEDALPNREFCWLMTSPEHALWLMAHRILNDVTGGDSVD
jgi:hypothetical protein